MSICSSGMFNSSENGEESLAPCYIVYYEVTKARVVHSYVSIKHGKLSTQNASYIDTLVFPLVLKCIV